MATSSGLFLATIYNQSQLAVRKHVARYWSTNTGATAVPLSVHPSPVVITTKSAVAILGGGCLEEVFCRPSTAPVDGSHASDEIMTRVTQISLQWSRSDSSQDQYESLMASSMESDQHCFNVPKTHHPIIATSCAQNQLQLTWNSYIRLLLSKTNLKTLIHPTCN